MAHAAPARPRKTATKAKAPATRTTKAPATGRTKGATKGASKGAVKGAATTAAKSARKAAAKVARPPPRGTGAGSGTGDWRAQTLERMRRLIREAAPGAVEEVKWRKPSNGMQGIPVWSDGGILCTGETYKEYVKLTFARGAALPDPAGLFNAGFGGGTRRAIDLREGESVDPEAFRQLVREAVALNHAA